MTRRDGASPARTPTSYEGQAWCPHCDYKTERMDSSAAVHQLIAHFEIEHEALEPNGLKRPTRSTQ